MLGKLVNKFKRQTLQDGNGTVDADGCSSPPAQVSPPMGTRRSARLNEKAEKEKGGGNGNGDGISVPGNNSCLPPNSPSPPNTVCAATIPSMLSIHFDVVLIEISTGSTSFGRHITRATGPTIPATTQTRRRANDTNNIVRNDKNNDGTDIGATDL